MFENIVGYNSVKNELLKFCDIMVNQKYYTQFGAPIPKGILLYGEPGVGKTLCATELIRVSGRNSYTIRRDVDSSKFLEYIKSVFDTAKQNTPSIIFLDDLDKFGDGYYNSPEYNAIQTAIDETKGYDIFIIATSNDLICFPRSLLRPGRFDRTIWLDVPSGEESKEIIMHYLRDKKIDIDVNIDQLSKMLDGHSCATLESVINMAALYAGYDRSDTIKMIHITNAILSVVHDKPESDFKENYSYLVNIAYHEAGHVVVSELLKPGSVTLATIRQKSSFDSPFIVSRNKIEIINDVISRVKVTLGGKAAIELKYGYCDIGASADLDAAMHDVVRIISSTCYCGFEYQTFCDCGMDLINRSDAMVAPTINGFYNETLELLRYNWNFVEVVTQELLKKETLTATDITAIKQYLGYNY